MLEGIEYRCPYFISVNLYLTFLFLLFAAIHEFDSCCKGSQNPVLNIDRNNAVIYQLTI